MWCTTNHFVGLVRNVVGCWIVGISSNGPFATHNIRKRQTVFSKDTGQVIVECLEGLRPILLVNGRFLIGLDVFGFGAVLHFPESTDGRDSDRRDRDRTRNAVHHMFHIIRGQLDIHLSADGNSMARSGNRCRFIRLTSIQVGWESFLLVVE
jgi:hypothetical protein